MFARSGLDGVPSPALLFDAGAIDRNLDRMLAIAGGDPTLLRPHLKTHKCAEILARQLDRGIRAVKCATLTEAALAASAGVPDVLISYPLVGPNLELFARLLSRWPETRFSALVDSAAGLEAFARTSFPKPPELFLDLDVGMGRTGIAPGPEALSLVRVLHGGGPLRFAGVHAYDGHIHDADPAIRRAAFETAIALLDDFLSRLDDEGIAVPLVVSGGTPTFALHAERAIASTRPWQCSPGTTVLWDAGYGAHYPDLPFEPAAFLLTRVISHPGPDLACLDLGHKAVSAENPIANRVRFPELAIREFVSQSEEHLVIATESGSRPEIGATLRGIPYHVCPSVALYDEAQILRDGELTGETWSIPARRRRLDW